jgi:uncharacterized protein RhaS with RHS repeats
LPALVSGGTNTYLQANGLQSAIDGSNTTSYALTDPLGSVRVLTDASGSLTGSAAYDALGFTGALADPSTGGLDFRAIHFLVSTIKAHPMWNALLSRIEYSRAGSYRCKLS